VVLGSQGVGKTSLVQRYCKGSFNPSETTSTVGASFMAKRVVDSDTDTVVRLQIWDTGTRSQFSLPHLRIMNGRLTVSLAITQPARNASARYRASTTVAPTPVSSATA
jgi:GTPase SAR1 family protein